MNFVCDWLLSPHHVVLQAREPFWRQVCPFAQTKLRDGRTLTSPTRLEDPMRRRFYRKPPTNLCAEPGAEDGIDPRLAPRDSGHVDNRKALQLCRQVERALSVSLEGEILRDLAVQSVMPAPDSSRLLVTFTFHGTESITSAEVRATLDEASARLRSIVAAASHRKKTPQLAFQVKR